MEQNKSSGNNVTLLSAEEIEKLNPKIRMLVQWLRAHGFNTCDSGDGETHDHACDLSCPYVHIRVNKHDLINETDRLVTLLGNVGINLTPTSEDGGEPTIESSYLPVAGFSVISLFNITMHPDQCDFGIGYRGGKTKEEWAASQNQRFEAAIC